MQIYLLYERYYDDCDDLVMCDCYPYQNYEDALRRISDETHLHIEVIRTELSIGSSIVKCGNWVYEIEETELL